MKSAQQIEQQQASELQRLFEWVGSKSRLADQLGIARQTVYAWEKRGRISATCAIEVERLTKGLFTKEDLRPDVTTWIKEQ